MFVIQNRIQNLIDLVFPPTCAGCGSAGTLLCDHCAQAVRPVSHPICPRCGRAQPVAQQGLCSLCMRDDNPVLTIVRAAAFHTEPLRAIIHHLKYGGQPELAPPLGRYLLAAFAAPEWRRAEIDFVIPVPMFPARQKERGYNQAALLAAEFCRATGLPLAIRLLKRVRFTQAQVGLNARERKANVMDAFEATAEVRHKNILLIDDVYTTGSTLRACAEAALIQGANQVYALALAIPTLDDTTDMDSF